MIEIDLHAHTLMSQCGIHSHIEMLTAARDRGMAGLAITDHGPALGGRHPGPVYERLKAPVDGIRFFKGIEANVTDENGSLDVPPWMLPHLDIVLLGLHVRFERRRGGSDWTEPLINAMRQNPWVDIITHPVDENFPLDLEKLAAAATDSGIVLELNNSKILYRRATVKAVRRFLDICRDTGCRIAVCSDAHTVEEVGDDRSVRPLLEDAGIPEAQVINANAGAAMRFIAVRRAARLAWVATAG